MKKFKLLTSLSTLGVVAAAVPVVATSCSKNDDTTPDTSTKNYLVCGNTEISMPSKMTQADFNALVPADYTFESGVQHSAIFVNDKYIEADLITELQIGTTDGSIISIPTNFLSTCTNLRKLILKNVTTTSVSNLTLAGSKNSLVEISVPKLVASMDTTRGKVDPTIGNSFLYGFTALEKVELSGFSEVVSIGNSFMSNTKIYNIDLSPLSNVKQVGTNFVGSNLNLINVDLSPLTKLESVGTSFFTYCPNIESVNFTGLTSLKTIGNEFFWGASSLKTADLSKLTKVETVGNMFMEYNMGLTDINLSGFTSVKTIGQQFLGECYSLKSVDVSKFPTTVTFANSPGFLRCSKNLESVNLGAIPATAFGSDLTTNDDSSFTRQFATQDDFDNWTGINLTVDASVKADWTTATNATTGRFRTIAWSSSTAYCRKVNLL